MAQAAVADRQRRAFQLVHDRAHDAGPGEDHLGPLGLKAHDLPALFGREGSILLDLAVDLRAFDDRSLHDVGIVLRETVHDGGDVRDCAPHADQGVGRADAVELSADPRRWRRAPACNTSGDTAWSRRNRSV